jgi:N-acetylneuraminic acid mutarotase
MLLSGYPLPAMSAVPLFSPQHFNEHFVVEQGKLKVELEMVGAGPALVEWRDKNLVYHEAYRNTDSLIVTQADRSKEFLYLRDRNAPRGFEYRLKMSAGVRVKAEGRIVSFRDRQERYLVESSLRWKVLEGRKKLLLVVEPQKLRYPLVVDPRWRSTASMSTARVSHTATLLQNGKVLILGGVGGSNTTIWNSAELYNPASSTWSNTGSMCMARHHGHTATLLQNGKVLIAGGFGNNGTLSSTELYDPATGTWSNTGSMSMARYQYTATLLQNGKALIAGGFKGIGGFNFLNSSELYNPASGTWSSTGSLNTARNNHTATLLPNGKVLVAGGGNSGSYLSSAELYDPASGTWSSTGSLSTARNSHTATLLPNGKVLVAGGFNSNILSSAELYDPATGTWSTAGSLNTARSTPTATLLPSGKVLVAGGVGSKGSSLSSAELYDPATGTWSTTGSMSTARVSHTSTLLQNGKVLVTGGINFNSGKGSYLSSAELYDPATGTWSTTDSLNTAGMSIQQSRQAWEDYANDLKMAGLPVPSNPYLHLDRSVK